MAVIEMTITDVMTLFFNRIDKGFLDFIDTQMFVNIVKNILFKEDQADLVRLQAAWSHRSVQV